MKAARILAAGLISSCIALTAQATSCMPAQERIYMICNKGACVGSFHVTQIRSFGACGRRDSVAKIDPQTATYVDQLIRDSQLTPVHGLYSAHFRFRWWGYERSTTFDAFKHNLASTSRSQDSNWLKLESEDISAANIERIREENISAARMALAKDIVSQSVYWSSFAAMLLALIHSIHMFFARLYADIARRRRFIKPLLIQTVVMLMSCCGLGFIMALEFWPGILLIPTIPVVWLAEAWAVYRWRKTRRATA